MEPGLMSKKQRAVMMKALKKNTGSFPSNWSLETVSVFTCDGEDCRGISEGDKPVSATAVIDDNFHVVGAQGNVVCTDGE